MMFFFAKYTIFFSKIFKMVYNPIMVFGEKILDKIENFKLLYLQEYLELCGEIWQGESYEFFLPFLRFLSRLSNFGKTR